MRAVAEGKKERDSKLLEKAWGINQFILAATNAPATNREAALRRSFELMPQISRETGTNWLRSNFAESPRQGLIILSAVSQMVQQGMNERALDQRQKNLELQTQLIAGARGFIGTYGGFSYLAPFYGVSSLSFFSRRNGFESHHLELADRVFERVLPGGFLALDRHDAHLVEPAISKVVQ